MIVFFFFLFNVFGKKKKKENSPGAFRWIQPRSPQWRRFILLSVAIYKDIYVSPSCCCWWCCCCFSALLIIILFYGQSWIFFLLPCWFCLLCQQFTVQSKFFDWGSGTFLFKQKKKKKSLLHYLRWEKIWMKVKLCNMLRSIATVSIVLLVV